MTASRSRPASPPTPPPALLGTLGLPQVTAFSYFTNGLDTRTRGVDFVSSYTVPFSASSLELTAAYSYNDTEVRRVGGTRRCLALWA